MKAETSKIIENYRNYAILHWDSSREGDYKTANRNYAKLTKIFNQLLNNKELQEKILIQLLHDSSFAVQVWAAAHCLGIGRYTDEALSRLECISNLNDDEAPRFEARMTLQVWKEKGTLTF